MGAELKMPTARVDSAVHIPALDGLRGFAIAVVLFHHLTILDGANPIDAALRAIAPLAAAGVDLFFVLSGFLITGILYDSKGANGYFRNFYARRILRIFPLYYAVLVIALIILPQLPHPAVQSLGTIENPWWYWLYLSNFELARIGRYTHGVLDVTWSLAIEEQFYLVWPAIVLLCSRTALMRICIAAFLIALLTRSTLLVLETSTVAVFSLTPCRMDALAAGAWIALAGRGERGIGALREPARRLGFFVFPLLVGMLIFSPEYYDSSFGLSIGLSIIALASAAGLVLSITSTPIERFFRQGWLRFLGRYSYALYLCHVPVHLLLFNTIFRINRFPTVYGSQLPGQIVYYTLATLVSLMIALLSWNLFEKHFLKLKRLFPSGRRRATTLPEEKLDPEPTMPMIG